MGCNTLGPIYNSVLVGNAPIKLRYAALTQSTSAYVDGL